MTASKLTTKEKVYFKNNDMGDIARDSIVLLVGCAIDQYDINILDDKTKKIVEKLEKIRDLSEWNHDYLFQNKK